MKCPHCGVYLADGERECPVCGKRIGMRASKKPVHHTNDLPYSTDYDNSSHEKKKSSVEIPAAKELPKRPPHTHDTSGSYSARPVTPPPKSKNSQSNSKKSGCLVFFIIIFILFLINIIFSSVLNGAVLSEVSDVFNSLTTEDDYDDSIYFESSFSNILPTGTWTSNAGLIFTVYDDDTVTWLDTTVGVVTSDEVSVMMLELTEDNALDYCTEDELKKYPVSEYTQYMVYISNSDTDADALSYCLYLQDSIPVDQRMSFDSYNCDTGEYETFTYMDIDPYQSQVGITQTA